MHPALSILLFTTLIGSAQGLTLVLALTWLIGVPVSDTLVLILLLVAEALLLAGLLASFFHLGNKLRAWRAVLMWKTSWMSREVIVLPAFIALVGLWTLSLTQHGMQLLQWWLAIAVLLGVFMLWYCTAMIYACLRFIQEWAHKLTVLNFTLIGLASGSLLACALFYTGGNALAAQYWQPWALVFTLLAWGSRILSLWRNDRLHPKSTLQSATGIASAQLQQKSMGMSAGSFNTREFFHHASAFKMCAMRYALHLLGFALPAGALFLLSGRPLALWWAVVLLQWLGLLAERWYFFAQAKHPQNLYYQTVS